MPYTPIVSAADLKTHMYTEVVNVITRGDGTITTKAINAAISEVKMYLSGRYDLVKMFGSADDDTAATYTDEFLLELVKAIAKWHLCKLSNVAIDLSLARSAYEDAIDSLKAIQKGMAQPDGWPYRQADTVTPPDSTMIEYTTRKKSNNYW